MPGASTSTFSRHGRPLSTPAPLGFSSHCPNVLRTIVAHHEILSQSEGSSERTDRPYQRRDNRPRVIRHSRIGGSDQNDCGCSSLYHESVMVQFSGTLPLHSTCSPIPLTCRPPSNGTFATSRWNHTIYSIYHPSSGKRSIPSKHSRPDTVTRRSW